MSGGEVIFFLVWEVMYVVKTLEKCEDMADKAQEAIDDINVELENFENLEAQLDELYANITTVMSFSKPLIRFFMLLWCIKNKANNSFLKKFISVYSYLLSFH